MCRAVVEGGQLSEVCCFVGGVYLSTQLLQEAVRGEGVREVLLVQEDLEEAF